MSKSKKHSKAAFGSQNAYWDFAKIVRSERRFIFDGEAGKFLKAVRAASLKRLRLLKPGHRLYRAQAGSDFDVEEETGVEWEHPLPESRMIPEVSYIKRGGRANPHGFAYLYLATDDKTALAEMRPWLGESLTLAAFEIQKEVKIVDCQAGPENWGERLFEKKSSTEKTDEYVWNDISKAFSRPVNREDQEIAYLPTQVLAEAFKAEGFAGLAYRSGLERGTNVVLFDVAVAKTVDRFAYNLKKVSYDFEAVPNYAIFRKKDNEVYGVYEIHTESP